MEDFKTYWANHLAQQEEAYIREMEAIDEEYSTRILYFHTKFRGNAIAKDGFHPWLFVGTRKDYDKHLRFYENNHENGKIIGEYCYDTYEEWYKVWGQPVR